MVNENLKTGICDFARKKPINLNIKEKFNGLFGRMEAAKPLDISRKLIYHLPQTT